MDEKFRVFQEYTVLAEINEKFYRPAEVEYLCGSSNKASEKLNWKPKTSFVELVKMMVDGDIKNENI